MCCDIFRRQTEQYIIPTLHHFLTRDTIICVLYLTNLKMVQCKDDVLLSQSVCERCLSTPLHGLVSILFCMATLHLSHIFKMFFPCMNYIADRITSFFLSVCLFFLT